MSGFELSPSDSQYLKILKTIQWGDVHSHSIPIPQTETGGRAGIRTIFPSSEACARPSSTLLVLRVLQQKDVQGAEKTNVD